jgi:hypothetical protein
MGIYLLKRNSHDFENPDVRVKYAFLYKGQSKAADSSPCFLGALTGMLLLRAGFNRQFFFWEIAITARKVRTDLLHCSALPLLSLLIRFLAWNGRCCCW